MEMTFPEDRKTAPQSQGIVKRANQTITSKMAKISSKGGRTFISSRMLLTRENHEGSTESQETVLDFKELL